jgi:hypothetical protein
MRKLPGFYARCGSFAKAARGLRQATQIRLFSQP